MSTGTVPHTRQSKKLAKWQEFLSLEPSNEELYQILHRSFTHHDLAWAALQARPDGLEFLTLNHLDRVLTMLPRYTSRLIRYIKRSKRAELLDAYLGFLHDSRPPVNYTGTSPKELIAHNTKRDQHQAEELRVWRLFLASKPSIELLMEYLNNPPTFATEEVVLTQLLKRKSYEAYSAMFAYFVKKHEASRHYNFHDRAVYKFDPREVPAFKKAVTALVKARGFVTEEELSSIRLFFPKMNKVTELAVQHVPDSCLLGELRLYLEPCLRGEYWRAGSWYSEETWRILTARYAKLLEEQKKSREMSPEYRREKLINEFIGT